MSERVNEKHNIPSEFALVFIVVIYSFSIALITKSGFGMSSLAAVPYLISQMGLGLSFGTWNFIIQACLVVGLMIATRKCKAEYAYAFFLAFAFSKMIDVHEHWLTLLPDTMAARILYFVAGFFIMAVGIYVSNNSSVPIMPTDLFPRDIAECFDLPYEKVKTTLDVGFLVAALVLSVGCMHRIMGIGIGTVICALITGKAVGIIQKKMKKKVTFHYATKLSFLSM